MATIARDSTGFGDDSTGPRGDQSAGHNVVYSEYRSQHRYRLSAVCVDQEREPERWFLNDASFATKVMLAS